MNDQTLIFSMVLDVMRDTNRIGLYMMWEALEALVYLYGDKEETTHQCCGCHCVASEDDGPSEFDLAVEEDEQLGREKY